jgi:integrase
LRQSRIELRLADWPAGDRAAWEALFRAGDLLDGRGEAVHWAAATRRTNAKHYARWLGWLAANDLLEPGFAPWQRALPDRVEAYARSLLNRVAPRTAASALIGLKCVLQRMHPDGEWRWLKDLTNRLDCWAEPSRRPPDRGLSAPELFGRALAELETCAAGPLEARRDQLLYRDTLIVALLIACPVRLRNLAMIEIGTHLQLIHREWHLRFDEAETKTRQPIHLVLPRELDPFLDLYLGTVWPAFPRIAGDRHLWPGQKARPMAEITIYNAVIARTRALFGTAVAPHAFRTIAATFLSESSPEDALHARPLLGHRQPETTERYYVRASQLEAARSVSAALRAVRDA